MKNLRMKNNQKESGQSMVELAVSFLILMILLAGVVDLGRLAFTYIAMRDAAQEGASFASIFPNNNFEIIERVKAGIVDTSRIQIIIKFGENPDDIYYKCYYNVPEDEIETEFVDNNCMNYIDTKEINDVEVNDMIEITVRDPRFPITMPLIGVFIGNEINLETTIRDIIISIPKEPTPTG